MAKKLDPDEMVTFKEMLIANRAGRTQTAPPDR